VSAVNTTTEQCTLTAHGLVGDDQVLVVATPGVAFPTTSPAGAVASNQQVYVNLVDVNNFQLRLTAGGAAVNFTTTTGFDVYRTAVPATTVPHKCITSNSGTERSDVYNYPGGFHPINTAGNGIFLGGINTATWAQYRVQHDGSPERS
jgi:hypothetical protein